MGLTHGLAVALCTGDKRGKTLCFLGVFAVEDIVSVWRFGLWL